MPFRDLLIPYARTAKLRLMRARAVRDAGRVGAAGPEARAPVFIVGCGRSGTTILGRLLSSHPGITYLREPYHLWSVIDERADVTGLHTVTPRARFFLDAEDATDDARTRFDRLIRGAGDPGARVIEKTPHNAARLGWLDALAPGAQYVHIVRNGLSVAHSIDRIATVSAYKMAFKPRYNQWWGTDEMKWHALAKEVTKRGYYADDVPLLTEHAQRGAYEWLVSLGEVDRLRDALGARLLEFTYTRLTTEPEGVLRDVCSHIGVECTDGWLAAQAAHVRPERVPEGFDLRLPPGMCEAFNAYQARWGFAERASELQEA